MNAHDETSSDKMNRARLWRMFDRFMVVSSVITGVGIVTMIIDGVIVAGHPRAVVYHLREVTLVNWKSSFSPVGEIALFVSNVGIGLLVLGILGAVTLHSWGDRT